MGKYEIELKRRSKENFMVQFDLVNGDSIY